MNGVAYGAVFDENHKVVFRKTTNSNELSVFQGSKYIYSDMSGTYKDILDDLKQDRTVVFVGTSCQCAGLKKFVPKALLEKLYLVDIICHGMPPEIYFEEYMAEIEEDKKDGYIRYNYLKGPENQNFFTFYSTPIWNLRTIAFQSLPDVLSDF